MPKGVHKPKFLEQLEAFLQKELRSLDCAEMVPSEKRLQVWFILSLSGYMYSGYLGLAEHNFKWGS